MRRDARISGPFAVAVLNSRAFFSGAAKSYPGADGVTWDWTLSTVILVALLGYRPIGKGKNGRVSTIKPHSLLISKHVDIALYYLLAFYYLGTQSADCFETPRIKPYMAHR